MLCNEFQQIPTNVSQCLALSKTFFKDDFGKPDIVRSWQWVLEYSKATGKKITAGLINFLVNPPREDEKVKVKVTKKKWEKFQQKARDSGLAPESVLESLIDNFVGEDDTSVDPDLAEPESDTSSTKVTAEKPLESKPRTEDLQDLLTEHNNDNRHFDTT
ncbi:MAG: hypothetical protein F6K40_24255 [Okeania sp. SIO3I5]|uniref:hypothetical protein n=1 Tax=Okeania sp. SIO3I5 TaxID=2607805 RepID=UPI0013B846E2|nr:hypothetical protein [Okeania sp. SIO3I5]NEQ39195.1 hypothetical protein [Okeania sp. SIO3I5]